MIKVILTGSGGGGGPGIIKSLRRAPEKIYIIGLDNNEKTISPFLVDKFYQVPLGDDPAYPIKLFAIAKKEKAKIILPLNNRELLPLSLQKEKFEKEGIKINISSSKTIKVANNKYLLTKICEEIGVPSPEYFLVKSFSQFKNALVKIGYPKKPVCIKPPVSNGQRGLRIIDDSLDQLDLFLHQKPINVFTSFKQISFILEKAKPFPELLAMEYLPGSEYTVDVLANQGEALLIIPRIREEIKLGYSFRAKTENDKKIISYSQKITKKLNFHGLIGLQFKRDKQGIAKIIESNPRLQGTNVLSSASGVNLPYLAIKLLLGEKFKIPKVKWGTKMCRYWEEIFYDKKGLPFAF